MALDNESASPEHASSPANESIDNDRANEEHDPHFEPIISLPEVSINSLEEDETEIFKGRCKLFRFVNEEDGSEWKERGTGDIKLLKHEEKKTVRVLMRQEKTLKIRANHYVTPYMKLQPNCNSDRAFVWYVICDFADEESKGEMFAVKFVNSTQAAEFKKSFEESVKYVATSIAEDCAVIFSSCAVESDDHNSDDEVKDPESTEETTVQEKSKDSDLESQSVAKVEESLSQLNVQ